MPANSSRENPTETLIAAFGGIRPMAKKLKIPVTTIQGWKKRQAIPLNRHDEIATGATSLGITLADDLLARTAPDDSADGKTSSPPTAASASTTVNDDKPSDHTPAATSDADTPAAAPPTAEEPVGANLTGDSGTIPGDDTALSREQADEARPTATERMRDAKQQALLKQQEAGAITATAGTGTTRDGTNMTLKRTAPVKTGRRMAAAALIIAVSALLGAMSAPYWLPLVAKQAGITLPGQSGTLEMAAMATQISELRGDMQLIVQRLTERQDREIDSLRQTFNQRLDALNRSIASIDMTESSDGNPRAIEQLRRDIGRDLEPLASAIDDLEARLNNMADNPRTSGGTNREVSLVLAVGNLASALRTSSAYQSELAAIPRLLPPGAGAGDLIATLEAHAETGVPTAPQLAEEFADLVGPALQAIHVNADQSTMQQALGQLRSLITVRRTPGEVEGDDPSALLARAEHRLRNGDVAGAYGLTDRLPEAAQNALQSWRDQALARITVNQAIDQLIGLAASTSAGDQ